MNQAGPERGRKEDALQALALTLSMMDTRDGEDLLLQAKGAELILEDKFLSLEVYVVEGGLIYAHGLSGGLRKFLTADDLKERPIAWITNTLRRKMH